MRVALLLVEIELAVSLLFMLHAPAMRSITLSISLTHTHMTYVCKKAIHINIFFLKKCWCPSQLMCIDREIPYAAENTDTCIDI